MRPQNIIFQSCPLQGQIALYLSTWLPYLLCVAGNQELSLAERQDTEHLLLRARIAHMLCWWHPRYTNM
jgi:hypothetical protein